MNIIKSIRDRLVKWRKQREIRKEEQRILREYHSKFADEYFEAEKRGIYIDPMPDEAYLENYREEHKERFT